VVSLGRGLEWVPCFWGMHLRVYVRMHVCALAGGCWGLTRRETLTGGLCDFRRFTARAMQDPSPSTFWPPPTNRHPATHTPHPQVVSEWTFNKDGVDIPQVGAAGVWGLTRGEDVRGPVRGAPQVGGSGRV
jgi:hypothetical protein